MQVASSLEYYAETQLILCKDNYFSVQHCCIPHYRKLFILKEILVTASSTTTADTTILTDSSDSADAALYKELIKYCTIMVSTVPMFIFYPFIQKYFESGVMIGAIKG